MDNIHENHLASKNVKFVPKLLLPIFSMLNSVVVYFL
jgi:hypothetical protein